MQETSNSEQNKIFIHPVYEMYQSLNITTVEPAVSSLFYDQRLPTMTYSLYP